jgi:enamine deaminase RidA (YjgF/YER057c/UK114 family)
MHRCVPRNNERTGEALTKTREHPYTEAVVAGGLVFVSGALGVDAEGMAVHGRRESLDAALRVLEERLGTVGARLADVVNATYYVTDIGLRDEANEQFIDAFHTPRPSRTFVEVSRLPYGATVEIAAVARVASD